MPFKETITIEGRSAPGVNLNYSVGADGENFHPDVMLIQTMFHYLAYANGKAMPHNGFPDTDLPSISGKCDNKTLGAIHKFQRHYAHRLLKVDGTIHPASYEERNIGSKDGRLMSITLLHLLGAQMHWHHNDPYYITGLVRIMPLLGPWLS